MEFIKKVHDMGLEARRAAGLLDETEIRAIKPYVERVSFDFVYDDRVIAEVISSEEKRRKILRRHTFL